VRRPRAAHPHVGRSAFAGFRFPPEVITVAVRWYLRYSLSYRDIEELLAERGIEVDHVTVYRWVQRFTPPVHRRRPPAAARLRRPLVCRRDLRRGRRPARPGSAAGTERVVRRVSAAAAVGKDALSGGGPAGNIACGSAATSAVFRGLISSWA
jgi:hypothetical protein